MSLVIPGALEQLRCHAHAGALAATRAEVVERDYTRPCAALRGRLDTGAV